MPFCFVKKHPETTQHVFLEIINKSWMFSLFFLLHHLIAWFLGMHRGYTEKNIYEDFVSHLGVKNCFATDDDKGNLSMPWFGSKISRLEKIISDVTTVNIKLPFLKILFQNASWDKDLVHLV